MRSQTVLDWIAAAMHCGPAGQRARLIHARGFLRHLKAGFLGGAQSYPPIPTAECFLPVWPRTAFVVHDAASDFRADSWCGRRKEKRWTARTLLTFVPARICCRTPAGVVPSGHECQFLVATLVCLFGCLNKEETYWYLTAAPELLTAAGDAFCRYRDGGEAKCLHPHPHPWPLRSCSFSSPGI